MSYTTTTNHVHQLHSTNQWVKQCFNTISLFIQSAIHDDDKKNEFYSKFLKIPDNNEA